MNKKISIFLSVFLIFSLLFGITPKAKAATPSTFHVHINCDGGTISSVNGAVATTDIDIPVGGTFMVNFYPSLGNDLTLLNDNVIDKTSSAYKNYYGGYFQNYTYIIYSVDVDHTIDITMGATSYIVNVSSNEGGTISYPGVNTVSAGTSLFISAIPSSYYKLYKIYDNGVEKTLTTNGYYVITSIHENHNVIFYFAKPPITIIAYATGTCGQASPTYTYAEYGASASVSFYPCTGYELDTITDNGIAVIPTNPYVLTNLLTNHTVIGTFRPMSCYVNLSSTGRGSISISPVASYYNYGSTVKLTMTPDDIYSKLSYILIDGVKINYSGTVGSITYTISNLAKKTTAVQAVFSEVPDITPPSITMISPTSDLINLSSDNYLNIEYTVSDDRTANVSSSIILDGTNVYQSANNETNINYKLVVSQGMNEIIIRAQDMAGNKIEKKFNVFCDSVPPILNVKDLPEITKDDTIKIIGNITDEISGINSLVINGISVFPSIDGSFSYTARLVMGNNTFKIVATDKLGNTSQVVKTIRRGTLPDPLQKGKIILIPGISVITVDGVSKDIGVAPLIKNGYTFVPIRFLSDYSGAELTWLAAFNSILIKLNSTTISLKIGSNIATVNGKNVKLDAAPQIINGHTLVPLRFVAENLGFDVIWNSSSKVITLIKK